MSDNELPIVLNWVTSVPTSYVDGPITATALWFIDTSELVKVEWFLHYRLLYSWDDPVETHQIIASGVNAKRGHILAINETLLVLSDGAKAGQTLLLALTCDNVDVSPIRLDLRFDEQLCTLPRRDALKKEWI